MGRSRIVSMASISSGSAAGLGRCSRSASRNTWVGSLHWNWQRILPVRGPWGPTASGPCSPMSPGVERHVGLPAAPDHRVAPAHQVAVARLQGRGGVGSGGDAVHAQGGLPAPVHHVEQDAPVAPVAVHRLEHGEVRRKLHLAGGIARRQVQVRNPLIPGLRRVHRVVGRAFQQLIRAHLAEALARRETGAFGDFQFCNCQDASGWPTAARQWPIFSFWLPVSAGILTLADGLWR